MSKCWICGKEMTKTIGGCAQCNNCGVGYNDLVFRPQNETIIYNNKIVENGTSMSFTCDSCGREVFCCNIVNGMKFCAKCYQETFGNQQNKESSELLVNSLAEKDRQITELKKQLEEKEKTIQGLIEAQKYLEESASYQMFLDIQKQLEEKEKRLKQIDDWKVNYGYTNYDDIYTLEDLQSRAFQSEDDTQIIDELLDYFNISDENKILPAIKKQLQSQSAEIVEKIREWGQKHYNWVGDGTGYDGQEHNECIGFNMAIDQLNEVLDTILKEYQK